MSRPDRERRIVTVLFADLVGFTSLSEELDPEDVSILQDRYFEVVRETVGRHGGSLEKFIGDAAMAVFGGRRAREDDAERAVRAALALANAVQQLGASLGLHAEALQVRVGINTGEVVAHPDAGPAEAMVTGDAVNVAARLQAGAPGGGVLLGETTALAVAEAIEVEDVGPLELKGKAEPVRASLAVGLLPERSRERAMGELRAPTLGRDRELETLDAALASAGSGGRLRWLMVAPPGVGKTRVIDEFAARAGGSSAVLRARLRPDVVAPFQGVAQLIVAALAAAGGDLSAHPLGDPRREAAGEFLLASLEAAGVSQGRALVVRDELLEVAWPSPSGMGAAASDREARLESWLQGLDALAAGRPSVWLVEDVHWTGGDLLAFLDAAVATPGVGRLLLATARPSILEAAPEWCADDPTRGRHLLHLPPLSPSDTRALVAALTGDALPDAVVERVADASDGNPLFVEELLRSWVAVGILRRDGEGWRLDSDVGEVPIPSSVRSIYAAQLDELPPGERLVARRASIAGRRFPVAALGPLEIPDPEPAVEGLLRRALVAGPEQDPFVGETYAYRHALLRDAGYASLARAERARLHVRLARWIEEVSGERWAPVAEVIARHFAAALDAAPLLSDDVAAGLGREQVAGLAATWFERAGEAALDLAAHDAARALYRRALDLTLDEAVLDRARRLERLGAATAFAADMDEGSECLQEAMRLYREAFGSAAGDDARADLAQAYARATHALGDVLGQQLKFHEMVELADAVLAELGQSDGAEVGWVLLLRARARGLIGGAEDDALVWPDIRRAVTIAERAGNRDLELEAGFYNAFLSDDDEGVREQLCKVEGLARELRRWERAAEAIRHRGGLFFPDRPEDVRACAGELRELAETRGLKEQLAWADYQLAEAAFLEGEWDEALQAGLRAVELGERNAYHRATVRTWHVLTAIAAERGERGLLEKARAWYEQRDDSLPDTPYARVSRTQTELAFAGAGLREPFVPDLEYVREGLAEAQVIPSFHYAVDAIVEAWLRAGDTASARGGLETFATAVERAPSRFAQGHVAFLGARVRSAAGAADAVVEPAREALALFREVGAAWWVLRVILALEEVDAAGAEELATAAVLHNRMLGSPTGPEPTG
jgi:class 3 adenylate cyclase/tetratricopeptide (TPR) repeat protein